MQNNIILLEFTTRVMSAQLTIQYSQGAPECEHGCNIHSSDLSHKYCWTTGTQKKVSTLNYCKLLNLWNIELFMCLCDFSDSDFLPRGSGIVTRRPLVLQLVTAKQGTLNLNLQHYHFHCHLRSCIVIKLHDFIFWCCHNHCLLMLWGSDVGNCH